jgi:dTDP-4-dehydrorhamnose reductase
VNSRSRILILGSTGQVGLELQRSFSGAGEIIACNRESVDLASANQVRALLRESAPNIILNAAAYTAVDRAETQRDNAMAINARAPGVMAEEALRADALLVHYSTDYVFDGTKTDPWVETDKPNPLNVYGATKLAGEEAIQRAGGKYLIFRTSWVYGPHGNNFLQTMLRLGRERDLLNIVDDQYGAPTSSIELANATRTIVDGILAARFTSPSDWAGAYHMTCSGRVSWYGFAKAIFARVQTRLGGRTPEVNPIPSSEYPVPATRPHNSVLSNEKLFTRFRVRLSPWEAALDEVILRLQKAPAN